MCDLWLEPVILETRPRKKEFKFWRPTGLVEKMAIPQQGPKNKLTKLYKYGHKISKRFKQADYSNTKAQTHSIKLAILASFLTLILLDLARPNNCRIPW